MDENKKIYDEAVALLNDSDNIEELYDAIIQFESIENYEDSSQKLQECKDKIEQLKKKNKEKTFEKELIEQQKKSAENKKAKYNNRILVIASIVCLIIVAIIAVVATVLAPNAKHSTETTKIESSESLSTQEKDSEIIESRFIIDNANLFTDNEKSKLESKLDDIRIEKNFEVVIHTTNTFNGKSAQEYADNFYDDNDYGYGPNRDGCIIVINMNTREWWLSTCGRGIEVLTDDRIESIGNSFTPELSQGDYYEAMITFLRQVKNYL